MKVSKLSLVLIVALMVTVTGFAQKTNPSSTRPTPSANAKVSAKASARATEKASNAGAHHTTDVKKWEHRSDNAFAHANENAKFKRGDNPPVKGNDGDDDDMEEGKGKGQMKKAEKMAAKEVRKSAKAAAKSTKDATKTPETEDNDD